ncbi:serine/threonine protein phosphatase [Arenibacter aquaticus]|uniref:Serine/threonine protein phosphatase n=1 Tax=Arenibacter aquaticus TaxID=2489054 RepID=A0A430K6B4_9FLAO|nr:metallophosphoesterase [Arenibacter aquaticus]RTE54597.1 serine/threonine protein phosphatase [Arenibacter aquaticus]
MRKLVIGDLHSGLKALKQVLEKAKVTPSDHLIFLGDYVDGWSEAVGTVNFLMELKTTHRCTFIRGNHDELCNDWLKERKHNPLWLQHGGKATLESYAKAGEEIKLAHIDFYDNLENYYLDEDNRLFIHAGFTNLRGVSHEYFTKTYYWDRTLWEMALSLDPNLSLGDEIYPQRLTHYKEIFIGHTPVTRIGRTTPKNAANIWNVDTGAAFRGPLTIMDISTKQYWQSDPVYLFYPSESGRN